jgi:two-component system response regulator RegA
MISILIVDDDKAFTEVLAQSLGKRDHEIRIAHNVAEAVNIAEEFNPEWVLADLKMPGASGLELIPKILEIDSETKIVVLTGYAGIPTAVEAIKLGAIHYLSKPVSTDEIIAAFHKDEGDPNTPVESETLPLELAEREYILNSLKKNNNNISLTARELGLHRRTLQRKLEKIR